MTSKIRSIFNQAIEIASKSDRSQFLNQICGDDFTLRELIEDLLESHRKSDDFLEKLAPREKTKSAEAATDWFPASIGPYRLVERLGEGGMGVVFVAEQTEPVERQVALKLIKPGIASNSAIERFESERRVLAMLSHPYIAQLFDAGTTSEGQPYFVMELVHGLSVTEHCDHFQCDVRERLGIFASICEVVQYAHLNGVIHRDLKPSNILVLEGNAEFVPKVIDFGIAKALQHPDEFLGEESVIAMLFGTPEYMSPEQASLEKRSVDARSDIYSLGVLLYQLLTGDVPFTLKSVSMANIGMIYDAIRETVPQRPSQRILKHHSDNGLFSARKTTQTELAQVLRGELDWIVLKALEKDPHRRYQSASDFAADIQRHLNNEQVEACPPSFGYRFRKVVSRHRGLLLASASIVVALVMGASASLVFAIRTSEALKAVQAARSLAEENEKLALDASNEARMLLYASDIRTADNLLRDGDLRSFREYIDRYSADHTETNQFRGFEWHYLNRFCRRDHQVIVSSPQPASLVRFSADGRYLLLGWSSGAIELRTADDLKLVFSALQHISFVNGCDFHPTRRQFATIGDDGRVIIWDIDDQAAIRSFPVGPGQGSRVFYNVDGTILATSSEEGRVRFWDSASGEAVGTIDGFSRVKHRGVRWRLCCSPRRDYLLIGDGDGKSEIYDFESRRHLAELEGTRLNPVTRFAISPDGNLIAGALHNNAIAIWDGTSGKRLSNYKSHRDDIQDLAFHSDGTRLASADRAGVVRIHQVVPGHVDTISREYGAEGFVAHEDRLFSIDFSPDGHLVTAGRDGTFRNWEEPVLPESNLRFQPYAVTEAKLMQNENTLLVSESGDGHLQVWNPDINEKQKVGELNGPANVIAISHDGQLAAASSIDDGSVLALFDLTARQKLAEHLFHNRRFEELEISRDRSLVSACDYGNRLVYVWTFDNLFQEPCLVLEESTGGWISPDQKILLVHRLNNIVAVDLMNGQEIRRFVGHKNAVPAVVFSNDGQFIVSGSHDRSVRVWNSASGELLQTIYAHDDDVSTIAVSPDQKTIASGDVTGKVSFSQLATGRVFFSKRFADHAVWRVEFSTDGNTLSVFYPDRLVLLDGEPSTMSE